MQTDSVSKHAIPGCCGNTQDILKQSLCLRYLESTCETNMNTSLWTQLGIQGFAWYQLQWTFSVYVSHCLPLLSCTPAQLNDSFFSDYPLLFSPPWLSSSFSPYPLFEAHFKHKFFHKDFPPEHIHHYHLFTLKSNVPLLFTPDSSVIAFKSSLCYSCLCILFSSSTRFKILKAETLFCSISSSTYHLVRGKIAVQLK